MWLSSNTCLHPFATSKPLASLMPLPLPSKLSTAHVDRAGLNRAVSWLACVDPVYHAITTLEEVSATCLGQYVEERQAWNVVASLHHWERKFDGIYHRHESIMTFMATRNSAWGLGRSVHRDGPMERGQCPRSDDQKHTGCRGLIVNSIILL